MASGADGSERLDLHLPGALLGDAQRLGNFAQGVCLAAVEAVAHGEYAGLALGERLQRAVQGWIPLLQLGLAVLLPGEAVGEQLAPLGGVLVGADPGVEASDGLVQLAQPAHVGGLYLEALGDLILGGVAAKLGG